MKNIFRTFRMIYHWHLPCSLLLLAAQTDSRGSMFCVLGSHSTQSWLNRMTIAHQNHQRVKLLLSMMPSLFQKEGCYLYPSLTFFLSLFRTYSWILNRNTRVLITNLLLVFEKDQFWVCPSGIVMTLNLYLRVYSINPLYLSHFPLGVSKYDCNWLWILTLIPS